MMRFSRLLVPAFAASLLASPISAQLRGGPIGGIVGGVTGTLGNSTGSLGGAIGPLGGSAGGLGGTIGGPVGGTIGGVGGTIGGFGSTFGGVSNGLFNGSSGGGSGGGALGGLVTLFTQRGVSGGSLALDMVSVPDGIGMASPAAIESYREARIAALIAANRAVLDRDFHGQPVRKRELIATNPDPVSLSLAIRAGFQVVANEPQPALGLQLVTLAVPARMNVRQAMKAIRRAAPALQVDFNHVYEPSGGALLPVAGAALAASRPVAGAQLAAAHRKGRTTRAAHAAPVPRPATRIAMIDGGVAAHPSLARASIVQQGFAGAPQPTGHGTAVGSLLVGEQGPFRGAARGAQLFVGDVYGGDPAAGSVASIVRALSWAASKSPSVVNISLVGPSNTALARAVAALRARGIQVVAAVGNDGPAAPPQYPASYPGVVSITGVDAQGKALPEAGRAAHLDFAAPGADMIAAFPGNGYTPVHGTSFAAPLAAARLALAGSYQRLAMEARPGRGKVGLGIVCAQCRTDPRVIRRK